MGKDIAWLGTAVLKVKPTNPKWKEGFLGAFAAFACAAPTLVRAIELLFSEFDENGYEVIGFQELLRVDAIDRNLTSYENKLANDTKAYPVQFRDVHLHKEETGLGTSTKMPIDKREGNT